MAKLDAKYEEQKTIQLEKTKKESEELEVLFDVLNEVKGSLNERIAKYGEEEDKRSVSEYIAFDPEESMNYDRNIEESFNLHNLSDQLGSDSFSLAQHWHSKRTISCQINYNVAMPFVPVFSIHQYNIYKLLK